jgi:hypothetical protein
VVPLTESTGSTGSTEAPGPEGGWATAPRPPITVLLTDDQARRLTSEAVRTSELRPLALRLAVATLLGLLLASSYGPGVGVLAGAALAALAVALFVLRRRVIERSAVVGSARTSGYDGQGRFVLSASGLTTLSRGSARTVQRRDGVAVVRPAARRGRPVVLLDELLTTADEAVLVTAVPEPS